MTRQAGVWVVLAVVLAAAGCGGAAPRRAGQTRAPASHQAVSLTRITPLMRRLFVQPRLLQPVPRSLPFPRPPAGGGTCFVAGAASLRVAPGAGSCPVSPCVMYASSAPAVLRTGPVVVAPQSRGAGAPVVVAPGLRPIPCRHPSSTLRVALP